MLNLVESEGFTLHPFVFYNLVFGMDNWPWRGNGNVIAATLARVAIRCFQRSDFDGVHIGLRACRNLALTQLGRLLDSRLASDLFTAASGSVSGCTERTMKVLKTRLRTEDIGSPELNSGNVPQRSSIFLKVPSYSPDHIAKALTSDDILLRRDAALAVSRLELREHPDIWTACLADYEGWVLDAASESFSQQPLEERRAYLHRIGAEGSAPLPAQSPYVPVVCPEQLPPRIGLILMERGAAASRYILPLLESALESDDPHARATAVEGLSFLEKAGEGTKHALRALLNDPEPYVRMGVVNVLFRFSDPGSRSLLLKVVAGNRRDESRIVRNGAVRLLGEIEFIASDDICAALLEVANHDRNYGVRCAAIIAFGNCAPVQRLDELCSMFDDPTPGQRGSIGQWARQVHEWAVGSDH